MTSSMRTIDHDLQTESCIGCRRATRCNRKLRADLEKYTQEMSDGNLAQSHFNAVPVFDASKRTVIEVAQTSIKCWWDCESFDTLPYHLVDSKYQGTYYVKGCFCSPQCALAYNMYIIKDERVLERKSLTKSLYNDLHNGNPPKDPDTISEAPPRELLSSFGGSMSLKRFRKKLVQNRHFSVTCPPIRTIQYTIQEQTQIDNNRFVKESTSSPMTYNTLPSSFLI